MEWYGSSQVEIPQLELIYVLGSEEFFSLLIVALPKKPQTSIYDV